MRVDIWTTMRTRPAARPVSAASPVNAALDVYEQEPLAGGDPLVGLGKLPCTPPPGHVEQDSHEYAYGHAFEQIAAFALGRPINVCDPQAMQ